MLFVHPETQQPQLACLEDKPEPILKILRTNAEKLIQFIHNLLDGIEDADLQREKEFLLMELGMLHTKTD